MFKFLLRRKLKKILERSEFLKINAKKDILLISVFDDFIEEWMYDEIESIYSAIGINTVIINGVFDMRIIQFDKKKDKIIN